MKYSTTMIVFIGIAACLLILRIITPTPEQMMYDQMNQQNMQMMEQMNQQNQQIQMQSMQMLNGMQTPMMDPYAMPGYNQGMQGYPQGGYVDPNANPYNYTNGNENQNNNGNWGW